MTQVFYRDTAIGELRVEGGQLKYRAWDCRRRTLAAQQNKRNRELMQAMRNSDNPYNGAYLIPNFPLAAFL